MSNVLVLAPRLPCPRPGGGTERAYRLLQHLAADNRVFLGAFAGPEDEAQVDALRPLCADIRVARLEPRRATLRSLNGLLADDALTLRYYRDSSLFDWVDQTCRRVRIDVAIAVSATMAQYVEPLPRLPLLIDFGDARLEQPARHGAFQRRLTGWIPRREEERLLAYERQMVVRAARSFFGSDSEAAAFRRRAPECAIRIETMGNGVDGDFFFPDPARPSPFPAGEQSIVFAGAQDEAANREALAWLDAEVLTKLRENWPRLRLHVLDTLPSSALTAAQHERIAVAEGVTDLRPHLQHAALVVAPLRAPFGSGGAILQAMAMARPVLAGRACAQSLGLQPDVEILAADGTDDYIGRIDELLRCPEKALAVGTAARRAALERFDWDVRLSAIDPYIEAFRPVGVSA